MTVPAPPAALPTSPVGRALVHVALAGVLGAVVAVMGAAVLMAAAFGGWPALGVAAAVLLCVSSALAAALDRAAGPGAVGRAGSVVRGLVVGGLGSGAAMAGLAWAMFSDVQITWPVLLRYAAAALPFVALAALQWSGVVRIAAAVLLVTGTAAVVVPAGQRAQEEDLAQRITTEVGTTEHPWVTDLDGYRSSMPQLTGSPLIWTPLEARSGRPEDALWLFRDQPADPAAVDPCALSVWTPGGDQPVLSCTLVREGVYLRTTDGWQELARHDGEVRVGVAAASDVPPAVLEQALAAARPMTDDEYQTWLDEGLTPGW